MAQALDQQGRGVGGGRLPGALHEQLAGPLQLSPACRRDALAHGHQRRERRLGVTVLGVVELVQRPFGVLGERERLRGSSQLRAGHRSHHRDGQPDGEPVRRPVLGQGAGDAPQLLVQPGRVPVRQRDRGAYDGRGRVVQLVGESDAACAAARRTHR